MTVYALIPARGGSKRIPRKNLELVGGVPLVALAVRAGRAARTVDSTWVSTDDEEIAVVGAREGANIVDRPALYALDETPMEHVLEHFLPYVRAARDDLVVVLEPTAPLRTGRDVDTAVLTLQRSGAPAIRLVAPVHAITMCHGADYRDAGLACVISVDAFRRSGCLFPAGTLLVHHGEERAIDVDDPADLERARAHAGR